MSKSKIYYTCVSCGHVDLKWLGKCPECDSWNSFEKRQSRTDKNDDKNSNIEQSTQVITLPDITLEQEQRINTGSHELDRVLGGGIVPGSVVLVGGDPGIGKSTLMLQTSHNLVEHNNSALYVSGEESLAQIKLRCQRLELGSSQLMLAASTNLDDLKEKLLDNLPQVLVIDSIQSLYSPDLQAPPGSLSQVKHCTTALHAMAKEYNIACFIVGHVTKGGQIAGPKVVEHIVDTVLYFEGDKHQDYRILRGIKNRFGPIEIAVFEMRQRGLAEVTNPSQLFLRERPDYSVGSTILPSLEGTRSFLVEIQALVSESHLGNPRRVVTGIDSHRAALITAVLEKKAGLHLVGTDVFVNAVGGMKIVEPAADLAIALSIISSFQERAFPSDMVAVGELGLTGELRGCNHLDKRLLEAERMGFTKALIPKINGLADYQGEVELYTASNLTEVLEIISG